MSEDFDLALRLLLNGYTLRWATYSDGGFKEGVSLTVVDELARWQKYAYGGLIAYVSDVGLLIWVCTGCNEIIFNPVVKWLRHGPISPQLRGFVWSIAPVHYKIGMMSCKPHSMVIPCRMLTKSFPCSPRHVLVLYVILPPPVQISKTNIPFSDGIAAATFGSILNYLLLGLAPQIDKFYLHSFEILLACTVVFPGIGNLGFTLLEYRLGQKNFFSALVENLRWVPFL